MIEPAQDYVILGPLTSPGLATVTAGERVAKWDIREGYGASNGSTIFHGKELTRFEVKFYLWLDAHHAQWVVFQELLKPPRGLVSVGLGIFHPTLALIGVSACIVLSVGAFAQDEYGGWECTVKFCEFAKAQPALSKAIAAIPVATVVQPDAATVAEQERVRKAQIFAARAAQ